MPNLSEIEKFRKNGQNLKFSMWYIPPFGRKFFFSIFDLKTRFLDVLDHLEQKKNLVEMAEIWGRGGPLDPLGSGHGPLDPGPKFFIPYTTRRPKSYRMSYQ